MSTAASFLVCLWKTWNGINAHKILAFLMWHLQGIFTACFCSQLREAIGQWYSTLYFVWWCSYMSIWCADLVTVHAWCYMRINCRVLSAMFCVDAVLQFNLQSCMGVFLYVYLMFTCSYCPCYGAIMSLSCSTILKKELWIKRSYGFVIS